MGGFDAYDEDGEISYEKTMLFMDTVHEAIRTAGQMILLFDHSFHDDEGQPVPQFGLVEDTTFGFTWLHK
jgi:hypothetical protein